MKSTPFAKSLQGPKLRNNMGLYLSYPPVGLKGTATVSRQRVPGPLQAGTGTRRHLGNSIAIAALWDEKVQGLDRRQKGFPRVPWKDGALLFLPNPRHPKLRFVLCLPLLSTPYEFILILDF